VRDKPAYRDALRTRRCLIVADGFYEWQARAGRSKLPWRVTRSDGAPFAFAGLWSVWHGEGDEALRTCTIVTTAANAVLSDVHDRMPVMLRDQAEEEAWLDHATPPAALAELLVPLPDAMTARRAVGPAVSDARYDGPDCLADAELDKLGSAAWCSPPRACASAPSRPGRCVHCWRGVRRGARGGPRATRSTEASWPSRCSSTSSGAGCSATRSASTRWSSPRRTS
jgi:hypothetical protein